MEKNNKDTQGERVRKFKEVLLKDLKGFRFSHFILSPTIYVLLRIYHKYVRINGLEKVDWNRPQVLVPSHQNAFMDAFLIISALRYIPSQYIYPLIRADVYENKILRSIVTDFHMIPVFRPRDRSDIASSNAAVFELCQDLLAKNHNLLIHAEGNCVPRKKVRALKKGFARIAFGAEERHDFGLNVDVVPVNINYQSIVNWGAPVEVTFNDPIPVKAYEDLYREEPLKAITKLTGDVHKIVESGNVNINDLSDSSLLEDCIANVDQKSSKEERFENHIAIAETINQTDEQAKNKLGRKNAEISASLDQLGLKRKYFSHKKVSFLQVLSFCITAIVVAPIYVFGLIHHYIPYKLSELLVKNYVKERQFKSSARFMIWLFGFPLYYLVLFSLVWLVSHQMIYSLIYVVTVAISGVAVAKLADYYNKWYMQFKQFVLKWTENERLQDLRKKIQEFNEMMASKS